mmetsp:Transcript_1458/g.2934  ORF Transcript_1458/g.2934 Transcript_1458/m.2934 type:complete len:238 (-) Transcript_1458:883-1596(-)
MPARAPKCFCTSSYFLFRSNTDLSTSSIWDTRSFTRASSWSSSSWEGSSSSSTFSSIASTILLRSGLSFTLGFLNNSLMLSAGSPATRAMSSSVRGRFSPPSPASSSSSSSSSSSPAPAPNTAAAPPFPMKPVHRFTSAVWKSWSCSSTRRMESSCEQLFHPAHSLLFSSSSVCMLRARAVQAMTSPTLLPKHACALRHALRIRWDQGPLMYVSDDASASSMWWSVRPLGEMRRRAS